MIFSLNRFLSSTRNDPIYYGKQQYLAEIFIKEILHKRLFQITSSDFEICPDVLQKVSEVFHLYLMSNIFITYI